MLPPHGTCVTEASCEKVVHACAALLFWPIYGPLTNVATFVIAAAAYLDCLISLCQHAVIPSLSQQVCPTRVHAVVSMHVIRMGRIFD